MKWTARIVALIGLVALISAMDDFAKVGDRGSPASVGVGAFYLETASDRTGVPNVVTAVLADYRGFDTMLETAVIFAAGIAILLLMRVPRALRAMPGGASREMAHKDQDLIIRMACRLMAPCMQLFALYVLLHGHISPGGGFQSGVILGASMILVAISFDMQTLFRGIGESMQLKLAHWGFLVFAGTGLLCMVSGGEFLNYGALDWLLPGDESRAHYHSMLIVEIGVTMTVMATMFSMYADLSSDGRLEEGL